MRPRAAAVLPDYDPALERAILGAPLMEPETLPQVLAVSSEHFWDEKHRLIHAAMRALHAAAQPIDVVMLSRRLTADNRIEEAGGPAYLAQLFEEGSIPAHVAGYIEQLVELWRKRRLVQLGMALTQTSQNGRGTAEALKTAADVVRELLVATPTTASAATPLTMGLGSFLRIGADEPEPEPYVEGVLSSESSGWIAGENQLGKTFYMIEEATCLALAMPVLGRFAVPVRRRVMIFEEEDSPRRARRRIAAILRGHGLDPDDAALELDTWIRLAVWEGVKLENVAMLARVEAEIAAFRPHVVYGDCLRKLTLQNINKQEEMAPLLDELDRLRRTYGCLFRLVHHSRKITAGGFRTGRGSQEMAGSYVLGAWGESSLFFEPIGRQQGAVRVTAQNKDDAPPPPFRLTITSEGPRHAPTTLTLRAEDDRGDDADDVVLQALAALPKTEAVAGQPGVTVQALAAHLKKSEKTIRRALGRLDEAGRCVVTGKASKQKDLYAVAGE